jgi:Tfp pilus assembly protein PilV
MIRDRLSSNGSEARIVKRLTLNVNRNGPRNRQTNYIVSGFTLIEVLIASFIFMTVAVIAIASFQGQVRVGLKTDAQRLVQNAAKNSIEAISRSVKLSDSFTISGNAPGSCFQAGITNGTTLTTVNTDTDTTEVFRTAVRSGYTALTLNGTDMTPSGVDIISFCVQGVPGIAGLTSQPFVTISLVARNQGGTSVRADLQAQESVQTTVTLRKYNKY